MKTSGEEGGLPETNALSVVLAAFDPVAGKRILDVGCGSGALASSLAAEGARVFGIDPNPEALRIARRSLPAGRLRRAGAEEMPFEEDSFDGAVFVNSLHHVPKPDMARALLEAARVVKPAKPIVVIEPLAEGSFFSALRPVEDETDVRTAAQAAIDTALASGSFGQIDRVDYVRRERFANLDRFLDRVLAADPARAAAVEERRPAVEAAFRRYARTATDAEVILEQPMSARSLQSPASEGLVG